MTTLSAQHRADGREVQPSLDGRDEFVAIVGDPAAGSAQREGGPHDRGVPGVGHGLQRFVERADDPTTRRGEPDPHHGLGELLAVFRHPDRPLVRPDQLDSVPGEGAILGERHRDVQRGLAAHGRKQRVRPLPLDHLGHPLGRDRFDVGAVGDLRVGHDRRRIRIDQDDPVALLLERPHRLGARVVELGALPDHDGAGTEQENGAQVSPLGH
jgi:hypothetical protein